MSDVTQQLPQPIKKTIRIKGLCSHDRWAFAKDQIVTATDETPLPKDMIPLAVADLLIGRMKAIEVTPSGAISMPAPVAAAKPAPIAPPNSTNPAKP